MKIEREDHDLTYTPSRGPFMGQEIKLQAQVFHRDDGRPPAFVINESLDNKGPSIDYASEELAGVMMKHYQLKPEQLHWYEQQSNGDYSQVKFETKETQAMTGEATKWQGRSDEYNISKNEVEARIAGGIIQQHDDVSRQMQQEKQWERGAAPAVGNVLRDDSAGPARSRPLTDRCTSSNSGLFRNLRCEACCRNCRQVMRSSRTAL